MTPKDQDTLIFIENKDHVRSLKEQRHKLGDNLKIVSLSNEIDLLLNHLGFEYSNIWEFVDTSDFARVIEDANLLAENWYADLGLEDPCLPERALFSNFHLFFAHALMSDIACSKVLDTLRAHQVLLFPITGTPFDMWRGQLHTSDVFNALLHFLIQERGVKAEYLTNHFTYRLRKWSEETLGVHSLHNRVYRLRRDLKSAFSTIGRESKHMHAAEPPESTFHCSFSMPRLLFFGWHDDFERHMSLQESIENVQPNHRCEIFHIYFGEKRYGGIYDDPKVLPLNDFLGTRPKRNALGRTIGRRRLALANYEKKYDRRYPAIFKNKWLKFQFNHWLRHQVPVIMQRESVCHRILALLKPDLVCLSDMNTWYPRTLALVAKDAGITTLSFNHGAYNYNPPHNLFIADYVTVWGQGAKEALLNGGTDPDRIHVVGNQVWQRAYRNNSFQSRRPTRQILVITSALGFTDLHPYTNMMKYKEAIESIIHLADYFDDIQVIIKSHPHFDYHSLYDHLVRRSGSNVIHIRTEMNVRELAKNSELVVVPNIISTAIFEALLCRKPVVFVTNALAPGAEYGIGGFHRIREVGTIVDDLGKLPNEIVRLLTDEGYREDIVRRGQRYLELFCAMDRQPLSTISDLIDLILDSEH